MRRWMRDIKGVCEGDDRLELFFANSLLSVLDYSDFRKTESEKTLSSFSFSFYFPSSFCLLLFPLFYYFSLDTFFSLPSGCWKFGPSCCCFCTQDWSMNPGAFSGSGPLSWAMYLMRKGRTGSTIFGKANSSCYLIVIIFTSSLFMPQCCHVFHFWKRNMFTCFANTKMCMFISVTLLFQQKCHIAILKILKYFIF